MLTLPLSNAEEEIDGRIDNLTKDLAAKYQDQSVVCLNGNGTCSADNKSKSCFARQKCFYSKTFPMTGLKSMPYDTPDHPTYICHNPEMGVLLGMVTTRPTCLCGIRHDFDDEGVVLFNLCIRHDIRGKRIGRRLVDVACSGCENQYATVFSTGEEDSASKQVMLFYKKIGFFVVPSPSLGPNFTLVKRIKKSIH